MNVEMGESLVSSWLKHIKGCQIVQTNWRPPWCLKETDYEYAKGLIEALESGIGMKVFPRRRGKSENQGKCEDIDVRQILGMTECDAVGVAFANGEGTTQFYAIESAFHSDGLHYKATVKKVVAKMVKNVLSLHFHMGARYIEVGFMTPIVKDSQLREIERVIGKMRSLFDRPEWQERFRCEISFYTRRGEKDIDCGGIKSFFEEVVRPLIMRVPLADDDSELFMRSMLMRELSQGHRLPVRSCLRSALQTLNCSVDDVQKLSQDRIATIKEANEKQAVKGYREWIDGCSLLKEENSAESARRVSETEEVKKKTMRQKPRKGARNGL